MWAPSPPRKALPSTSPGPSLQGLLLPATGLSSGHCSSCYPLSLPPWTPSTSVDSASGATCRGGASVQPRPSVPPSLPSWLRLSTRPSSATKPTVTLSLVGAESCQPHSFWKLRPRHYGATGTIHRAPGGGAVAAREPWARSSLPIRLLVGGVILLKHFEEKVF